MEENKTASAKREETLRTNLGNLTKKHESIVSQLRQQTLALQGKIKTVQEELAASKQEKEQLQKLSAEKEREAVEETDRGEVERGKLEMENKELLKFREEMEAKVRRLEEAIESEKREREEIEAQVEETDRGEVERGKLEMEKTDRGEVERGVS